MYSEYMRKKRKPSEDLNVIAFKIMKLVTEEPQKNQAAVALGRLGGLKGGPARKERLSEERRRQIASDAARARWSKERKTKQ